ncbi:16S rRNA (uracil(1498)-N(3))-methyltransferase [Planctobacterium marinum]|uniref:16S rRNA (uracil(1498)-N(3))-methyltransferase n=1 Tax=Planctobacterium marinum TaxID=1631968 RepID=UPI001E58F602|nr:16S rRNA (uracil(1498)-N(3))-methyltransferase [Planctobacterium marinum]MCC2605783.1 16S rRNA (uracil(1498)-N(3))-methyltransferase [Planctobacterium marinum]
MRIPRIYYPDTLQSDTQIELPKDSAVHITNVLRLKPGHPVVMFNGDGNEYSGEIQEASKKSTTVFVSAKLGLSVESPLNTHLAQGVSKGERMDLVMQKSVELGVSEITPIITERCPVKLSEERWQKKLQHWQKIIISACEQCGRNTLPILNQPVSYQAWIQQSTNQCRLMLHPQAQLRLNQLALPPEGVRLLIGPEGGLSDAEIYQAREFGYEEVLMGPRILRTETAALAALAILQAGFGDI